MSEVWKRELGLLLYWGVMGCIMGAVAGLWLLLLGDMLAPGFITPWGAFFTAVFVCPIAACLWLWRLRRHSLGAKKTSHGEWQRLFRHWERARPGRVVAAGFVLMVMWGTGYFWIGTWVQNTPPRDLWMVWDGWFTLWPTACFVYVSSQPITLLWFLMLGDALPWRRVFLGFGSLLAVCFVCFACFPIRAKMPSVPVSDTSTWLLLIVQSNDHPHNCFPSTHCATAMFAALMLRRIVPKLGGVACVYALVIGATTIWTRQHYVADAVAAFVLAVLCDRLFLGAWDVHTHLQTSGSGST